MPALRPIPLFGDRRRLAVLGGLLALVLAGVGVAVRAAVSSAAPVPASAASAAPAAAAKAGGHYVSQVTAIAPAVPGLSAQVEGAGITLMNHGTATATVYGVAGEPFLTVGPAGVRENTASVTSAVLAGRSLAGVAAKAAPRWAARSKDQHYRWADLRVQWQPADRAPAVRPSSGDVLASWEIPMKVGTTTVTVRGVIRWVAGAAA